MTKLDQWDILFTSCKLYIPHNSSLLPLGNPTWHLVIPKWTAEYWMDAFFPGHPVYSSGRSWTPWREMNWTTPSSHLQRICRDHFVYVPRQKEMTLHCNVISHWPGTYSKWSRLRYSDGLLNSFEPLPEPLMTYCQLDSKEQISVKLTTKS